MAIMTHTKLPEFTAKFKTRDASASDQRLLDSSRCALSVYAANRNHEQLNLYLIACRAVNLA